MGPNPCDARPAAGDSCVNLPSLRTHQNAVMAVSGAGTPPLAWARTVCAICSRPANLRRTLPIALVVGIILTLINQLDVFIHGDATGLTWLKVGLNFVVPFCVSNLGFLAGTITLDRVGTERRDPKV
jgi:hypothetical protein